MSHVQPYDADPIGTSAKIWRTTLLQVIVTQFLLHLFFFFFLFIAQLVEVARKQCHSGYSSVPTLPHVYIRCMGGTQYEQSVEPNRFYFMYLWWIYCTARLSARLSVLFECLFSAFGASFSVLSAVVLPACMRFFSLCRKWWNRSNRARESILRILRLVLAPV